MSMDKNVRKEEEKKGFIQSLAEKFGNKNRKKAAKGMKRRDRKEVMEKLRNKGN